MKVGDTLRGVRNCSRARHYYTLASFIQPIVSVPYVYSGLTLESEGNFSAAARAYHLACRIQALGAANMCALLATNGLDRFAAGCQSSYRSLRLRSLPTLDTRPTRSRPLVAIIRDHPPHRTPPGSPA